MKSEVPKELRKSSAHAIFGTNYPPAQCWAIRALHLVVLTGLRTVLAHENEPIEQCGSHLDSVVFGINTRILKIHGFTPSQLFLGMLPRVQIEDISVRDETVGVFLAGQKG